MIIYGWKPLIKTLDEGQFYCPQCDAEGSHYRLQSARQWATLYFIPIFPVGSRQEYVECRRCKGTFKESVLDMQPPDDQTRLLRAIFGSMQGGTSLEEAEKSLTYQGADPATAKALVEQMAGGTAWECGGCGMHFLDDVKRKCPDCGAKRPRN